jgi:glucosyl-dolichyl phosphate glucuronosyltransferase
VRETGAPWVAFVDDDNLLEPGWLQAVAQATRTHPQAGAIGGRVVLDWERPPPDFIRNFGFCFAEQEPGDSACEMGGLVGAGMVLRREALVESGWFERPLLMDRTGKRLVSGGDVEIAQRIRSAGYHLRFTPQAVLRHRIPSSRATLRYLLRMSYGLGQCEALVSALTWPGDWSAWCRAARRRSVKAVAHALLRSQGLVMASTSLSFAAGFTRGVGTCIAMAPEAREELLGSAAPKQPKPCGEWEQWLIYPNRRRHPFPGGRWSESMLRNRLHARIKYLSFGILCCSCMKGDSMAWTTVPPRTRKHRAARRLQGGGNPPPVGEPRRSLLYGQH